MGLVATVVGLLFLTLGSYQAARIWFRVPKGLPAALGAAVLGWTWLTLTTLTLGQLGYLTREALLISAAVAGLPALTMLKRVRGGDSEPVTPNDSDRITISACIALGATLWALILTTSTSLIFPVEVASDGPIYHLYFAAKWWKAQQIFLIPTPFGESAAPYFPAVGDLWHTWLFVMWGGDRLARIGQVPFLLVAGGAVYAICRRVGASLSSSIIATCCFVTVGPLLFFTVQPNVDTLFIAGYLLACYFALRYLEDDGGNASLALAGLSAGAAWGCKAPGIIFIPALLAFTSLAICLKPGSAKFKAKAILVLAVTPFINEGYWLVRNAVWTGNPLYPLNLSIFGHTILEGWYGADAMPSSVYYLPIWHWPAFVDLMVAVFDPRLLPFWLASLCGLWAVGRPRRVSDRFVWAAAGLAAINIALYWLVIPYRTQQRFFLHATGLAAIPLAILLDRGRLVRNLAVVALLFHILTLEGWPLRSVTDQAFWDLSPTVPNYSPGSVQLFEMIASLGAEGGTSRPLIAAGKLLVGLGCFLFGASLVWRKKASWRRCLAELACLGALFAATSVLATWERPQSIAYKFPNFKDYLYGWVDLDLKVPSTGSRIAYAGTNLPYYLMGHDFRNEVFYININKHRDWPLHKYHQIADSLDLPRNWFNTRPGWDRAFPDYDAWLENLRAAGIKLLVVARADPHEGVHNIADAESFTVERIWADSHPDVFVPLYGDDKIKTYAVRLPQK